MPKKEKKGLLILIAVAIIIIVAIVLISKLGKNNEGSNVPTNGVNEVKEEFVEVLDDGTKLNTSKTFSKAKKVDGLEISNIQLTYNNNGITTLLATVKNTTSSETGVCELVIKFYDKQNKEIIAIPGIVEALPAGGTAQLNTSVTADFANAYDFSVEKK